MPKWRIYYRIAGFITELGIILPNCRIYYRTGILIAESALSLPRRGRASALE